MSSLTDTQDEILPTPPPAVRTPRRIHRLWAIPLAVIAFATTALLAVASIVSGKLVADNNKGVEAPYALTPASAEPVEPRISFSAVPRFPSSSQLLFVTIREPQISLLDWFVLEGEKQAVDFMSQDDRYPQQQTPSQQTQINLAMMRSAKQTAEYVALSKLGYPAKLVQGDIIVSDLVCLEANADGTKCVTWAPSADVLKVGDKITKVDGVAVGVVDDLAPIMRKHQPGDSVTVEYDRPGSGPGTGAIKLIKADDGRTIIGFRPVDTSTVKLPFEVDINSGDIGGPSAGLAFTLTLLDELTPGDLLGGGRVAATGEINIRGEVGAIGGLYAKTLAVKQMGAKVFLVPDTQSPEDIARARAVAGDDLEIVPVHTLDDALAALAKRGGNGLTLGTPGASYGG